MNPVMQRTDELLLKTGLDAIVGYTRATIRHLTGVDFPVTGWGAEERTWVVWTPQSRILLAPGWSDPYAYDSVKDGIDVRFFHHPVWAVDALISLLRELNLASAVVGVETEQMPMAVADALRLEFPDMILKGADQALTRNRCAKDPDEVSNMILASRALELGFVDAVAAARVGITEREFARLLYEGVIANGADTISWLALRWGDVPMRMAFRDTPIAPGKLINIEMGCTVNGYFADAQRMIASTPVSTEITDTYRRLEATNRKTMLGIRPGMSTLAVYNMYLSHMQEAGLQDWAAYFLGHSIGLHAHEDHLLWAESDPDEIVPDHSFFSLEPAISDPVLLSVEDTVYVSNTGNDIISSHGDWSELVVLGQRVSI